MNEAKKVITVIFQSFAAFLIMLTILDLTCKSDEYLYLGFAIGEGVIVLLILILCILEFIYLDIMFILWKKLQFLLFNFLFIPVTGILFLVFIFSNERDIHALHIETENEIVAENFNEKIVISSKEFFFSGYSHIYERKGMLKVKRINTLYGDDGFKPLRDPSYYDVEVISDDEIQIFSGFYSSSDRSAVNEIYIKKTEEGFISDRIDSIKKEQSEEENREVTKEVTEIETSLYENGKGLYHSTLSEDNDPLKSGYYIEEDAAPMIIFEDPFHVRIYASNVDDYYTGRVDYHYDNYNKFSIYCPDEKKVMISYECERNGEDSFVVSKLKHADYLTMDERYEEIMTDTVYANYYGHNK